MITTLMATGTSDTDPAGAPSPTNPVTLADARAQCRIEADDDSDDLLLTAYIAAAKAAAQRQTGISLADDAVVPSTAEEVAVFRAAMLMMIAHWYVNREAATGDSRIPPMEMPLSATWLFGTIKKWTV